ncbi:hypothetical protein K439DRAFT_1616807 [Ramaria rubella]|nr:hypothetical protein K439DRAFT_1616807 [Ramaria rubella]
MRIYPGQAIFSRKKTTAAAYVDANKDIIQAYVTYELGGHPELDQPNTVGGQLCEGTAFVCGPNSANPVERSHICYQNMTVTTQKPRGITNPSLNSKYAEREMRQYIHKMFFQAELAYINPLPSCSLDAIHSLASTAGSPNLKVDYNIQAPSFQHNFLKNDEYNNAGALGLKPSFIGGTHVDLGDNPDCLTPLQTIIQWSLCFTNWVYTSRWVLKLRSNFGQLLHSGADPIEMPQLNVHAQMQPLPSRAS